MPNALPVRRWQLRQWQAAVRTGSFVARKRTAPQWHPPSWICAIAFLSGSAAPGDAEHAVAGAFVAQHVAVAADAQPLELFVEYLVEFRAAVSAPLAQQLRLDLEAERIRPDYGIALALQLGMRRAACGSKQGAQQGRTRLHASSASSRRARIGLNARMRSMVARMCASTAVGLVCQSRTASSMSGSASPGSPQAS